MFTPIKISLKPEKAQPVTEWPIVMPELREKDFQHGYWEGKALAEKGEKLLHEKTGVTNAIVKLKAAYDDYTSSFDCRSGLDIILEQLKKQLKTIEKETESVTAKLPVCATPRCAVGNVLSAFGQDPRPAAWEGSPLVNQLAKGEGPLAAFVKKFMKNLGAKIPADANPSLTQLSDLFEIGRCSIYSPGVGGTYVYATGRHQGMDFYNDKSKTHVKADEAAKAFNKTVADFEFSVDDDYP